MLPFPGNGDAFCSCRWSPESGHNLLNTKEVHPLRLQKNKRFMVRIPLWNMSNGPQRALALTAVVAAGAAVCVGGDGCALSDTQGQLLSRALPNPILAAYANWGQCDDKLVQAANDGVNVLIWFSINLARSADGTRPLITGPATGSEFFDCVASKAKVMRENGREVLHLVSIGGWNSPHPATQFTSAEWYAEWQRWNTEETARPEYGWHGFAGFDWDIEGNDDGAHHGNMFTLEALDLMGALSVLAKEEGYTVAMAPAQSYLDSGTSEFSRRVSFPPREPWHQDFPYSGRNAYAYLLARYGVTTFDFVSIQLCASTAVLGRIRSVYVTINFQCSYSHFADEGWSSANYAISEMRMSPSTALEEVVETTLAGYTVDFTTDPLTAGLGKVEIRIAREQLVIGLANAWTGPPPDKFLLVYPEDCGKAYNNLDRRNASPRGFMFWNVADEGQVIPRSDPPRTLFLARELAAFLFKSESASLQRQ